MASTKKFTLKNVENAIQRFKTEDLQAHVMPVFPELKWSQVRDHAMKEKLTLNKITISKILTKMFGQTIPEEVDIKMRVSSLKLIEVSAYPSRRIWSTFQLQGNEANFLVDMDQEVLDKALGRALRLAEIKGMRQVTIHDGMFWVMVLPTKKTKLARVVQLQAPTFFAYTPGYPYLFSPHKRGRSLMLHLEAIKSALGYTKVKPMALEGPDLRGLLQMLKCKSEQSRGTSLLPMQLDPPELESADFSAECGNVTVSEKNARIKYAESIFGTEPPALKTLTFNVKSLVPTNKIWGSAPIDVTLKFSGSNVFETLKDLTASGVLRTPYPSYMHKVLVKGKNVMDLKPLNVQQNSEA